MLDTEEPREPKLHEWNIIPKSKASPCKPETILHEKKQKKSFLAPITWTVRDIAKAGCLLSKPPLPVTFDDEQEMRRVYTLIYDVFRYKNVLMQALNDVAFFQIFPKLEATIPHVWLLFYDLYHRSFKKRETAVAPLASKLFDTVGLSFAENALWTQKVKLAAAISRLRIKNNALSLSELLPVHLKDEKVTVHAKNNPVTCWVNCIKVNDIQILTDEIEKTFNLKMVYDMDKLEKDTFKWDKHCPQIMAFHSSMRGNLARSIFIKNYLLIVQDKSFCRGAATFGKILFDLELTGSVIQTHVNSPRTTAYLATLLTHNDKIKKLMAFSAGKRKSEYECYFTELGVKNITIFADRLIDLPPDAAYMEEVVAVFATPPNSYSAVTDPIDLVCSRGGDLSMLEILTESEETKEAKDRVISILEEQRRTLRFAMSRPQIQFVLYETHSELDVENSAMINKTLRDINKLAKLQHANLQGRLSSSEAYGESILVDIKEINNNSEKPHPEAEGEPSAVRKNSADGLSPKLLVDIKERILENLEIPDTDIFITPDLPNLCPSENFCVNFKAEGCFLALIQRKEIVRLDDKYMIQMAENRGLFGSNTTANTAKSKSSRVSKKNQQKQEKKPKFRRKLNDFEMVDAYSQTSDEESSDDESSSEDLSSEETECMSTRSISYSKERPFSRSILSRLTSADIRKFVSPDFKQDAAFNVPSQMVRMVKNQKNKPLQLTNKRQSGLESKKTRDHHHKNIGKESVTRSNTRETTGNKRKVAKNVLKRLCLPTLSFMLRVQKTDNSKTSRTKNKVPKSPVSPCERFNRRNSQNI